MHPRATSRTLSSNLLEICDLRTHFYSKQGIIKAVDGLDLAIKPGEIHGLVGESGSGKTVTALSILRLISKPGAIVDGTIIFDNNAILELPEEQLAKTRGAGISMIFQNAPSSLNPVFTIGSQLSTILRLHREIDRQQAWRDAVDMLKLVQIADSERMAYAYPHQLSGGQAQRVAIAIALALQPKLVIADEPTSALDATIQAQILSLLQELSAEHDTAILLISHDLGVIAEMAERVSVIYAGRIIEQSNADALFARPLHPYTQGLIKSLPGQALRKRRLQAIPGNVPDPFDLPSGCRFHPRCPAVMHDICPHREPTLLEHEPDHWVSCWLYEDRS